VRSAAHERHRDREHEHQAIEPAAPLEDQDVPETAVSGKHRRQHCHDRQLHD
jgi:hypothetical protein